MNFLSFYYSTRVRAAQLKICCRQNLCFRTKKILFQLEQDFFYSLSFISPYTWNSQTTIGPKTDPSTALNVIDTELIDTVSSPYSNALEVPSA